MVFSVCVCVCSDSGRGSSLLDRAVADRRQLNAMTLPDFSDPETGERSPTHKWISAYLYLYSYGVNSFFCPTPFDEFASQQTSALLSFYLYFLHMYLSLSLSNTQIWFRVNGLMRWLVVIYFIFCVSNAVILVEGSYFLLFKFYEYILYLYFRDLHLQSKKTISWN